MRNLLKRLGPGLLYAGAAVGVSHLVQSTRAGADYGWIMILVVVIANIIKYPFFKAGPIYAIQTGKSLLEGIYLEGKWTMALFYLITLSNMFIVLAVVALISASVLSAVFGLSLPLWMLATLILLACFLILLIGKFSLLNVTMKWVIILLTITTIVSVIGALINYEAPLEQVSNFSFLNRNHVFFLIALVGWMPAPLDISLWHSEWTLAEKLENKKLNLKSTLFDFKVGYWGTTILAIAFVLMGSLILRGSAEPLSSSGALFAGQVIGMYTKAIGSWAFVFIAIAAFTTMFSTTLTVLDAYPRVMQRALVLSFPQLENKGRGIYLFFVVLSILLAVLILVFGMENMKQMVDFATSVSFLTAPILGILIWKVIMKNPITKLVISRKEHVLAKSGIVFLLLFSLYYLWIF